MDKISRKGHSFVRKEYNDKYEQAGTLLKAQTIAQKHTKEKRKKQYKRPGMSLKHRTAVRKNPERKCKQAHMSRKDRAIIRKRSRGKCEQLNPAEADPTQPQDLASPVPLTKEAIRLLNHNTEEYSKSSNMVSGVNGSVTFGAQSEPSLNAYDPGYEDALQEHDIFFADNKDAPPDFHELWEAILQSRESPGPDHMEAETFRAELNEAKNGSASVRDILPQLVPLSSLRVGKDTAFVKDQLWRRDIALQPELQPTLATPKPHVTIGWKPAVFKSRYKKAYKSLEAFISPIAGFKCVAWPIFTIAASGEGGSMRVAMLQNLHNGAVMLSNLFELKRKCRNEEAFFNKVHVIGVELTAESVQLSCYWACRNDIGIVEYFGKSLQCWSLFDVTGESLRNARRGIRNVVEWIKPRTFEWIQSDMAAFEIENEQILQSQIAPDRTLASQYGVNKRRRTKFSNAKSQSSLSPSQISKLSDSKPKKRARKS